MTGSLPNDNENQSILPEEFLRGYTAYCENRLPDEKSRLETLAEVGQSPKTLIISCCDSRVSPEAIFNMQPGELFVVRNVANLVPCCRPGEAAHEVMAAVEYAVMGLQVENIVVMGHARCGGVQNFLVEKAGEGRRQPLTPQDFVGKWTENLEAAWQESCCGSDADSNTQQRDLEEAGIKMSLKNLMTFPCVEESVSQGRLRLFGAWFDISSGEVLALDRTTGEFRKA